RIGRNNSENRTAVDWTWALSFGACDSPMARTSGSLASTYRNASAGEENCRHPRSPHFTDPIGAGVKPVERAETVGAAGGSAGSGPGDDGGVLRSQEDNSDDTENATASATARDWMVATGKRGAGFNVESSIDGYYIVRLAICLLGTVTKRTVAGLREDGGV
ncbi:MAG: hypothetical protein FWD57_15835, partial [Polyangiaceae bacterium]|nr:hypothetical protein [Polyangiaceae bacterium]